MYRYRMPAWFRSGVMNAWSTTGLAVSLITAVVATWRTFHASTDAYASGVYGMTRSTHAAYAGAALVLAAVFVISFIWGAVPVVVVLAFTVLLSIFYFTSFLRGFSEEE